MSCTRYITSLMMAGLLSSGLGISQYATAGGNHSPLLMLMSNKLKIEKLLTQAEAESQSCLANTDQAWKLMKPSLHMLEEYSQEKEGNYLNQEAYANSLSQRAKMLESYAQLMDRLFHLKERC